MNKQFGASTSFGASRAEHAANIAQAPLLREQYAVNHGAIFAENGLAKYVLVDKDGGIVARNSQSAELVKNNLFATNAATLRHEDFLVIQQVITEVRRRKLNGIADLQAAGLSFPVDISDQIIGTENISEFSAADQEQNPTGFDSDDLVFGEIYVPNPITHKSFTVAWRQQGFSYKTSLGLSESVRMVAERLEETLFNGNAKIKVNFNGALQAIHGYTTHPNRGTDTISDWSASANYDKIVNEVISSVGKMFSDQGGVELNSVVMYYPKNFKASMDRDYSSVKGEKTVAQRIMDIPEIKEVKFAEKLADSNVMFVEMLARTVQLGVASDIVSVPHTKTNPMAGQPMTTYAAMVQVIKADSAGNTGIMHCTV